MLEHMPPHPLSPPEPPAIAPHGLAAYPYPQLVLTLGARCFHVEIAGAAEPILVDARDLEALLATVGRWALQACSQSEGTSNG
ncbi:MAG: hypothetical protein ACKVQR_04290 [Aquabacterium sp.]